MDLFFITSVNFSSSPDQDDEDSWYGFILSNFKRHYFGNRAPFCIFIQESYMNYLPAIKRAFTRFLDWINNLHDVFQVSAIAGNSWLSLVCTSLFLHKVLGLET